MIVWLDAQISPFIALFLKEHFQIDCHSLRALGLRDSSDKDVFAAAKAANAILVSKDIDFVHLINAWGPPPKVIWLTCGNTSNEKLKSILAIHFKRALELMEAGEMLVEIAD